MKTIKRTVAALLATLMLATSTSFSLAAEEYSDKEAVVVAKVNGSGIMTGTDKGFEPSKSLTRAEAAAIIVRMKGISESAVKAMAGTTLFNDVAASHWASGYVNEASNLGIVKGVSATEFAPDREVTIAEFVTMAVRALGAGQLVDSEGTWPTNYVNFANENDILKDVTAIYTATATRMNAATIVANTLEAVMWEKVGVKSNGEIEWGKTLPEKTILTDTLNIKVFEENYIEDVRVKDQTVDVFNEEKDDYVIGNDIDVAKNIDLSTLKDALMYDVWYNTKSKEIVAIFKSEDAKASTVDFTEIVKFGDDTITLSIDGSEKKFDTEWTVAGDTIKTVVSYNGSSVQALDEVSELKEAYDDVKESIFGSAVVEGTHIVKLYAERYDELHVVDEVTTKRIKLDELDAVSDEFTNDETSISLTDEDLVFHVTKDGKASSIDEVKEDDVLFFYINGDDYYINVYTKSVEGKVSSVGTTYVNVGKTKYTVVKGIRDNLPAAKDEVELFLNEAGKVVAYNDVKATGNFAFIKQLEVVNGRKGLEVEVKLGFADGTESEALKLDFADDKFTNTDLKGIDKVVDLDGDDATVENYNNAIKTGDSILGSIVKFDVDGSDLYLITDTDNDIKYVESARFTLVSGTKTYLQVEANAAPFVKDTKYYITSSTNVLVAKRNTNDRYKFKLEKVAAEDLDYSEHLDVALVDINDDNEVKLVVIFEDTTKAMRTTDNDDWYVITDWATTEEDYNNEVTIMDINGKEYTYYTDLAQSYFTGKPFTITLDGEEIIDTDFDGYGSVDIADECYITDEKNGVLYIALGDKDSATADSYVLAEDVLYIAIDSDEVVSVGKDTKITEAVWKDDTHLELKDDDTKVDGTKILAIYTYTDSDTNSTEVVAIAYAK